jgi:hypothetical protein
LLQALQQLPTTTETKEKKTAPRLKYTFDDLCIACTRVINKELTGVDAATEYHIPLRSFRRAFAAFKKTGSAPSFHKHH